MAHEATKVELQAGINATDFTVADGVTISGGALCALTDPRTAAASAGTEVFAGIAAADKEANDGATNLALHETGIWDLYATSGAAIVAGELVRLSGANWITGNVGIGDISGGKVVGKSLETTASGIAERIEVDIGVRG